MRDNHQGHLLRPSPPAIGIPAQVVASAAMGIVWMQGLRLAGVQGSAKAWIVVGIIYLGFCGLILVQMRRWYPHDRIGGANMVTLLRMALVCGLLAPLVTGQATGQAAGWTVAVAATLTLGLDGVDGWLARRAGLVSRFGARFDMEVDAAFALVLALHVWLAAGPGPGVLLLGTMRYLFVGASLVVSWLRAPLPQRLRRKVICVVQLAALILLQTPLLSPDGAELLAWLATAAVVMSFALDIRWLWQRRG